MRAYPAIVLAELSEIENVKREFPNVDCELATLTNTDEVEYRKVFSGLLPSLNLVKPEMHYSVSRAKRHCRLMENKNEKLLYSNDKCSRYSMEHSKFGLIFEKCVSLNLQ